MFPSVKAFCLIFCYRTFFNPKMRLDQSPLSISLFNQLHVILSRARNYQIWGRYKFQTTESFFFFLSFPLSFSLKVMAPFPFYSVQALDLYTYKARDCIGVEGSRSQLFVVFSVLCRTLPSIQLFFFFFSSVESLFQFFSLCNNQFCTLLFLPRLLSSHSLSGSGYGGDQAIDCGDDTLIIQSFNSSLSYVGGSWGAYREQTFGR